MATNFSPCKGSYVLNQFPSNVMFGMNGFHVSASGAIQGHHGPYRAIMALLFTFYHLRPVGTKLGQNIYVQQNLNEFDHGSNWTKTTGVIGS